MALERSKGWRGLAAWGVQGCIAAGLVIGSLGSAHAQPAAAPPPAADFFRLPQIAEMVLSPSGKRAAIVTTGPKGFKQLGVIDLQPLGRPRAVAGFDDADVSDVRWTSDERLVYDAFKRGLKKDDEAGTFAVNHDGTEQRALIVVRWANFTTGSGRSVRTLPLGWDVLETTDDGSDDVLVTERVTFNSGDLRTLNLARLNTRTGELRNLSEGAPDHIRQWLVDGRREPRVVSTLRDGRNKVLWRQPGQTAWTEIADFETYSDRGFTPWRLDSETTMLVTSRVGTDFTSVYRYDLVKRQLDPNPVLAVRGFDLRPSAARDSRSGALVGFHFVADRPMSYWFNDDLARVQKSLDASLPPGRVNRILCGRCETSRVVGVISSSDRRPPEYYLFDRDKNTLSRLGAARPWLSEESQARRTLHRVAARDGLPLPVIVTHPAGSTDKQALPTVLLVHGGPWVRGGSLRWSAEAQFLASRGYRVLEPEFRGSTGYGWNHFRAGWKEWGGRMQDDLADTVQWAAQQGLSDSQRVCIMGASYGGYAALMAPIAHPGVFTCSVALAAVTDIRLMYDVAWSDLNDEYKRHGMPKLIGSPEEDSAMLDRASPLKRAGELKLPVLLAHGYEDRRVPIVHADRFAEAAKAAGVPVQRLLYKDDGHGFFSPESEIDYYQKVEAFLAKHLGSAAR